MSKGGQTCGEGAVTGRTLTEIWMARSSPHEQLATTNVRGWASEQGRDRSQVCQVCRQVWWRPRGVNRSGKEKGIPCDQNRAPVRGALPSRQAGHSLLEQQEIEGPPIPCRLSSSTQRRVSPHRTGYAGFCSRGAAERTVHGRCTSSVGGGTSR